MTAKSADDDNGPFEGLTDAQVLERAQDAMRALDRMRRSSTNPASPAWVIQRGLFDTAMGELSRRAMMQALWKIHESETPKIQDLKIRETKKFQ